MSKKQSKEKPATAAQIKALQCAYRKAGMDEEGKRACLYAFTSGRTSSTKELTIIEAYTLLSSINAQYNEKVREMLAKEAKMLLRSIYKLSFGISFLNKGYDSNSEEEIAMNKAKINRFVREKSKFRKPITQLNIEELRSIKNQFEALARKETE